MKRTFIFSLTCIAAILLYAMASCTKEPAHNSSDGSGSGLDNSHGEYVDLGLQSGTMWKTHNEANEADSVYNFYTYAEAVAAFGDSLPTKEQFEELKNFCIWTWTGNGYNVVGPNGRSIYMPAAGYRNCAGEELSINTQGNYWSSTAIGGNGPNDLYFSANGVGIGIFWDCSGHSVRLIQH